MAPGAAIPEIVGGVITGVLPTNGGNSGYNNGPNVTIRAHGERSAGSIHAQYITVVGGVRHRLIRRGDRHPPTPRGLPGYGAGYTGMGGAFPTIAASGSGTTAIGTYVVSNYIKEVPRSLPGEYLWPPTITYADSAGGVGAVLQPA